MTRGRRGRNGRRVVIVQEAVRRYRVTFYEELRARLREHEVRLSLFHSNPSFDDDRRNDLAELHWARNVRRRRFIIGGRHLVWQSCLRDALRHDLVVVEQASHLLLNPLLLALQDRGGPKLAFWGHGRNYDSADVSRAGEAAKRALSRRAHWWFPYTDEGAGVVRALGYPADRITVVRNATDTAALSAAVERVGPSQIEGLRKALGVCGRNVAVFVGSLVHAKRLEFLAEAGCHLRQQVPDFELIVVGTGPLLHQVERLVAAHTWMHYAGPRFGEELGPFLRLARVLLVPGWAGLVVVDSFAAGVPLVASRSGPHPPEAGYLVDGVNGLLVDDDGDPARYARAAAELLLDEGRRNHLAAGAREASASFSSAAMAARFASGIEEALRG